MTWSQSGGCHPGTLESALLCMTDIATWHSTHTETPNLVSASFGNWFNTSGVITIKIQVQNVGQVHNVRPSARCAHIWLCRFSLALPSGCPLGSADSQLPWVSRYQCLLSSGSWLTRFSARDYHVPHPVCISQDFLKKQNWYREKSHTHILWE